MSKTFFDYGLFTDALADGDVLLGVDVSDTTQSAQGSTKRATMAQVRAGLVSSSSVSTIVQLTQAEYDALSPPVATTLYIVVG